MRKRNFRIVLLLLIVVLMCVFVYLSFSSHHEADSNQTDVEAIVNNTTESLGSVEVIKNIGNPDGEKIAYVVGVHPLENDTHRTLLNLLPKQADLNKCYDIYVINVSEDFSKYGTLHPDDEPGRDSGQYLEKQYVYPRVLNGSYKAAVDVHSHGGAYECDTFVFSPVSGGVGEKYSRMVSDACENVSYYDPGYGTSPPFLTIPLNEHGIPAFYFEENSYFSQDVKDSHMLELIRGVDNLKFS